MLLGAEFPFDFGFGAVGPDRLVNLGLGGFGGELGEEAEVQEGVEDAFVNAIIAGFHHFREDGDCV